MTQHPDLFAALAAPFEPHEVKTLTLKGRPIKYVTARTAMNRLDNVLGPENWWDSYQPSEHSVLCTLTVRLPDGTTLAKQDAGGNAGMADQGDDDKSGYSDAFKRACVKFGVARYLYGDGVPSFGARPAAAEGGSQKSLPPTPAPAPEPAAPAAANGHPKARHEWESARPAAAPRGETTPTSGKGLFRWVKDQEERYKIGLLKYLNGWAKLQDFPGRMVDWDAGRVRLAHAEACRKLSSVKGDAYEGAPSP